MMHLNGKMTLLVTGKEVKLELRDEDSGIRFVDLRMTPEAFCAALGRLAHVPCQIETRGLDKLGLRRENRRFSFEMDRAVYDTYGSERDEKAKDLAKEKCPEGWEPDLYFNSQDSFFTKDGKRYAQCVIRRWVPKTEETGEE